jgi:two-component system sensor histidine kinase DesK
LTIMTTASAPQPRGTGAIARLTSHGARRWYVGALFGLVYQAFELVSVWSSPEGSIGMRVLSTAVLLALYAIFVVLPPLVWPEVLAVRLGAVLGYWALSCVLFPLIGISAVWVWSLLAVLIGFTWLPRWPALALVAAVVIVQLTIAAAAGWPDTVSFSPFITLSVGISMVFFGQLIQRNGELREAQHEIARLAVSEERARLARDLHDSLGHSLTVVAVKSELARKLVARDPAKAEAEIADIERLARQGLHELRAAVAGYRDVDLAAELASARVALTAAGIEAHLPDSGDVVRDDLRALFGWVVREGVTNVIRHSGARECWIELTATTATVRDDGATAGTALTAIGGGNGLRGLRERTDAIGARLRSGPRADGGFELAVTA